MSILTEFLKPDPIYSRHKAEAELEGLLQEYESVVYGLEHFDSIFKSYRSQWFLTETKIITINRSFPFTKERNIYFFEEINDMRLFKEEGKFVIISDAGEHIFNVEYENEILFGEQSIEQYKRYQKLTEN